MYEKKIRLDFFGLLGMRLTVYAPTPQNGQTHSNISLAFVDTLLECVWRFCRVGV